MICSEHEDYTGFIDWDDMALLFGSYLSDVHHDRSYAFITLKGVTPKTIVNIY